MDTPTATGKPESPKSTADSAHVECERHQRGKETAVPGLADHGAKTGYRAVQRDEAHFPSVPEWVRQPPDPPQAFWRVYHI